MKINFEQHISQSELQILPSPDQLEAALSEQYFLSNSLSSEQQLKKLRTCVKAKASQGNYPVAIALLDRLIALCPDNAVDYNNRGLMHFRNNQIVEALCDLSQALKINPHLDSAYNNRANCYAARGELAEAIADYDTALDLNPANLRAWINQGIAFRELEMYDLAIENFDITLIIGDSLQERIYAERGRTNYLQGDWNCAVADYQTALKILAARPDLTNLRQKVQAWLDRLLSPVIITDYLGPA
ncbi:MAG TPA: tetratricopeptide repeat protein [Coleofasciculaceae cyanobacterium]